MIVLVCGDRNWTNEKLILDELYKIDNTSLETTVVHGGCSGADAIAGKVARELHIKEIIVKADWAKYGKSAGPIRNQTMLDYYHPNVVLAFHNDLEHSKGTKDMVFRSNRQGYRVVVISEKK